MTSQPEPDQGRCAVCGKPLTTRNKSRYCSNACRQRAYRARVTAAHHTHDPALPQPLDRDAPGALAAPLDTFIGRQRELHRVRQLFRHHRLVTLTGPAGVGKSRLAIEFAGRLPGAWPRSVAVVALDTTDPGQPVSTAVATAMGIRPDAVLTALRTSRATVLLDNCEHLADPCARFVTAVLRHCPDVRILATSRQALTVPGEAVFTVDGLTTDNDPADALRLFTDRARALVRDFQLTEDNTADIAAICTELDANPLAIELAAHWVPVLPVQDIRARLTDRFTLLTTHSPHRTRSLRTALDRGHDLLSPEEQTVFRRLSIINGSFDRTTATALCADLDQVDHLVDQLHAKSLLVATGNRFHQLESIRHYAREHLDAAGETDTTRDRLIARLTDLCTPLMTESLTFTLEASRAVAAMTESLRDAVARTIAAADPRSARLSLGIATVQLDLGQLTEARTVITTALTCPGITPYEHTVLLSLAGTLAALHGDLAQGTAQTEQAVHQAESPMAEIRARYCLGFVRSTTGQLTDAEEQLARCVSIATKLDQPTIAAVASQQLARLALLRGDTRLATTLSTEALATLEGRPPLHDLGAIHLTAGAIALAQDQYNVAEHHFTEAIRAAPDTWPQIAFAVEGLAIIAHQAGHPLRTIRLSTAARIIRDTDGLHLRPNWLDQAEYRTTNAETTLGRAKATSAAAEVDRLTRPQVIAYAVDDTWPDTHPTREQDLDPDEHRIALLVADGRTNAQIADQLGLSIRTVAYRIKHIRDKLWLRSRAEISTWIAQHPAADQR